MPVLNVYGEEGPGSEVILDITAIKYAPLVMDLLPHGAAWDREDPILQELVKAESLELSRVDVRARALERELDPSQTFELLEDWEASYGLPDCDQPATLEGRRSALRAKLLAQAGHDQSFGWWSNLLDTLGYTLHFVDLGPGILTCIDTCIDVVNEEAFLWAQAVNHGPDDELLECVVQHNALLISYPIVHYLWQQQLVPGFYSLRGVACDSKGRTACVGFGGAVFWGSPDLSTWTAASGIPAGQDITCICACDDVLVAVGSPGLEAIYSSDGGKTWTPSAAFAGLTLYGISRGPLIDQVCVAVGSGGTIWRSVNAGATWAIQVSATAAQLLACTACQGAMVAVGLAGVVIRSVTNGGSWSLIAVPGLSAAIQGVAGVALVVVLVGDGGLIYRSSDAGLTWSQMTSPVATTLYAVTGAPSGRWTACGAGGVICQSLDNGITWTQQVSQAGSSDLLGAGYHRPDGAAILVGLLSTLITE